MATHRLFAPTEKKGELYGMCKMLAAFFFFHERTSQDRRRTTIENVAENRHTLDNLRKSNNDT